MKSWIVGFWSGVFSLLSWISPFALVAALLGRRVTAGFVDCWVAGNSALAVAALYLMSSQATEANAGSYLIFGYAWLRIFEIVVYQVNVLLFGEYRARRRGQEYAVHGYRRIVILLLHNYFEIVCWFGTVYTFYFLSGDLITGPGQPDPTFFSVFRDSLLLMVSFEADRYSPANDLGLVLFSIHASVGIFMTVLVFARFLALLPAPSSMDPLEAPSRNPDQEKPEAKAPRPKPRKIGGKRNPRG
jgi:hypothetical protein